jgi:hypothetical protein
MLHSAKLYSEIDNMMLEIESVIITVTLILLDMPSTKSIASPSLVPPSSLVQPFQVRRHCRYTAADSGLPVDPR